MEKPTTLLLSTAYLPPVEYFAYLLKFDEAYIEQFETYPKQTFRNRCQLYTECGKLSLSIPVNKVNGNNTKTKNIQIFYEEKWQQNHWRTIESAYVASPYFLYYKDDLVGFYKVETRDLLAFNMELTQKLSHLIGIETEIKLTTDFELHPKDSLDLRFAISPKSTPTTSHFPEYIQVFGDRYGFIPNLSIIDLLFNLGPETKTYLENIDV